MKIKLYIDVLFAVNVWMNAGLLLFTGMWFKYRKKGLKLLLGAAAGGIWSCLLVLLPPFPRWAELLITYGLIGPFMCRVAFGLKGWRILGKASAGLAVVSIFTGGFLNQLYYLSLIHI